VPINIVVGDIAEQATDAIVNAANEALLPGGGVCGAIHRAAGPELARACRDIGHCPTGSAVITPGFRLKARFVIHAVGPRWLGGHHGEADLLRRFYDSIFAIVLERGMASVAIPAISTGIFGYPLDAATAIAVRSAIPHAHATEIRFVCYEEAVAKVYHQALVAA
jgi:O-acetyl-ADP-ribose deacetylase (regulator of RNase III)